MASLLGGFNEYGAKIATQSDISFKNKQQEEQSKGSGNPGEAGAGPKKAINQYDTFDAGSKKPPKQVDPNDSDDFEHIMGQKKTDLSLSLRDDNAPRKSTPDKKNINMTKKQNADDSSNFDEIFAPKTANLSLSLQKDEDPAQKKTQPKAGGEVDDSGNFEAIMGPKTGDVSLSMEKEEKYLKSKP